MPPTAEDLKARATWTIEEVWNKGNWDYAEQSYADDMVVRSTSHPKPFEGREAFHGLHTELHTAYPDFHIVIEEIFSEGNRVAMRWTVTGTNTGKLFGLPPTGRSIRMSEASFVHYGEDARATEIWLMPDVAGTLQQLGLAPAGPPPRALIAIMRFTQKLGKLRPKGGAAG